MRDDPRANALFMEVLSHSTIPRRVLRWMNEAGVFGRFVPDFGRVVAQMQFDMYHHYTVDEHSIRALGCSRRSSAATEEGPSAVDRDHQADRFAARDLRRGAPARHRQGPRRRSQRDRRRHRSEARPPLRLDTAETETVAWLVRYHLLLSSTAFKRDLADPKTIEDFVHQVQSPERLRLLLIDRGRHPRRRSGGLERVETDIAADRSKLPRSGFGSATSSMARRSWLARGRRSWPGTGMESECSPGARKATTR